MNETLNCILNRRSCRSYEDKRVPEEEVRQIVEAGLHAPSGMNRQTPIFLVLEKKEDVDEARRLDQLAKGLPADRDPFYGAKQLILVLAKVEGGCYVYDGAVAMENMMLAAESLGIASCWIHQAKEAYSSEAGKAFLKKFGIEGDYEGIGHLIIGYQKGQKPAAKPIREGRVYWPK